MLTVEALRELLGRRADLLGSHPTARDLITALTRD